VSKPVSPPRIRSSARCDIELVPSPVARQLVLLSGCLFLLTGLAIIFHLPVAIAVKSVLASLWIGDTLLELKRQVRGNLRVCLLRLDTQGHMVSYDSTEKSEEIQILKGSVVFPGWAWLRLGFDDGLYYVEFLLKTDYGPTVWRRLHLIWRQAL